MAVRDFTGGFNPVDRIVVPVQGSDREFMAQQWAVEFASVLGLPLVAVHVGTRPDGEEDGVFTYLEDECRKWHVKLDAHVIHATDVVRELVEELNPRDLVVLGTRRLSQQYHVGSIAGELVRRAPCPVQIVRLA